MKTIHKFPFPESQDMTIALGPDDRVVSVGVNPNAPYKGMPCLWVLRDLENQLDLKVRYFTFIGTGHVIDDRNENEFPTYIGTVFDDPYVWHIFETIKTPLLKVE